MILVRLSGGIICLPGGHSLQPTDRRAAIENPSELCMFRYLPKNALEGKDCELAKEGRLT